jgi:DNA polymerase
MLGVIKSKVSKRLGKLILSFEKGNFKIQLPSGRKLNYPGVELEYADTPWGDRKLVLTFMSVDSKTKQWCREKTYGSKLVENCVQAIARDLLAESLMRLEKNGFPIAFHVHDEIVCEIPNGLKTIDQFKSLMETMPDWAKGLPIKAECWEGDRYRK